MTQKETIKLIGIITMAYPNFDKFKDENHIRSMVAVWADIFSEDNAGLVGLRIRSVASIHIKQVASSSGIWSNKE